MYILLTIILKELTLLWRDRAGLTILFIMPAVLLLAVTSVQHNVMMTIDSPQVRMLLVDHDKGIVSKELILFFEEIPSIEVIHEVDGNAVNKQDAFNMVAEGDYQFCLYIAPETSERFIESAAGVKNPFTPDNGIRVNQPEAEKKVSGIELYFDPIVQGAWRSAVEQSVKSAIFIIEAKEGYKNLLSALSQSFEMPVSNISSNTDSADEAASNRIPDGPAGKSIIDIDSKPAVTGSSRKIPNEVQLNIPAWTLFGMFFIVVPLSGALIRERLEGTLTRVFTLPVPFLTLLMGKILAYITICLIQALLMFLVGMTLLPLQGLPSLDLGSSPAALMLVLLSASYAAAGFGIMVGAVAKTYEQGSMFGAVTVVIAAAIGGVMLPVYVMPEFMQKLSSLSPFSWGLDAFLELFVRRGDIRTVLPQSISLILFGSAATVVALWAVIREKRL